MFRFGAPTLGYLGHLNHPLVFQWDLNLKLRWWPFGWRATSVGPVEQAEDRDETFFKNSYCRWWQLRCFCDFHPGHWESFPFWRAYVSKGVGNHQLDSRFFLRFCCYRIGFQTHDEDMCSITVGEDMVEVKHLTTLLCWWTPMVVFHAKKNIKVHRATGFQETWSWSWKHGVLWHQSLPWSCQWPPCQLSCS